MQRTPEQQQINAGCKCKECYGLAEEMILTVGHDCGLPHATGHQGSPTRLRLVTAGAGRDDTFTRPLTVETCTGGMLCGCLTCKAQIRARVKHGPKGTRQPWTPRRARTAA